MTTPTPTQAQIEAIIVREYHRGHNQHWPIVAAKCIEALTAAAQVGEPEIEYIDGLPVAQVTGPVAQVGEQDLLQKCLTNIEATGKALEAATIERCAQVVCELMEEDHGNNVLYEKIIAAIRMLKEKPNEDA